jgi:hypothetical protein
VNIPVFFSDMNPNPVPELETKKFAELLTHTLARTNQLPNDELGQTLRSAIALSVLGNDILGKISASQAANIGPARPNVGHGFRALGFNPNRALAVA